MTRQTPQRSVAPKQWQGRRDNGRDFLKAARDLLSLASEDENGNPIMGCALMAAIAFADAVTIKANGAHNTKDHAQLAALLERSVKTDGTPQQAKRLRALVAEKGHIQYHERKSTISQARKYVEQTERFVLWAEQVLAV